MGFFEVRGCWWCVFGVFLFVLVGLGLVFNEDCKLHDIDRPELLIIDVTWNMLCSESNAAWSVSFCVDTLSRPLV